MTPAELDDDALLRARLAALRTRIGAAARRAGRDPGEVHLLGASKHVPAARVAAAARAGLRDFGENYVQEAADKMASVQEILGPQANGIQWHFIGRLQRNKARQAVACFARIHTLDSARLATELERHAARAARPLAALVQVNLSAEPQKGGVDPDALPELIEALRGLAHVRVVGLMTMPAADPDPEVARPVFARLRTLRDALRAGPGGEQLAELSMGMSGDFEVAIEEGATWIRVGTALFGERPKE